MAVELLPASRGLAAPSPPKALGDEQLLRYLRDGFVVLQPDDLDADFHTAMFDAGCRVWDEARALAGEPVHLQVVGDNLRARIPLVERLLESPTVHGALTSVLGEGFLLHPHHFVHEATTNDQAFHQDGNLPWNDRAHYRTHRPNWAMLFYYPQPVTLASGPTEVLPGTQYWTTDFEKPDGTWHRGDAVDKNLPRDALGQDDLAARDRRLQAVVDSLGVPGLKRQRLELPAGSVVLANYDLMHRGSRSAPDFDGRRFMYKFYYLRTRDPEPASGAAPTPLLGEYGALRGPVEFIWRWLHGDANGQPEIENTGQAVRFAAAKAEDERIRLAYELGWLARTDQDALDCLGRHLTGEHEAHRRAMIYAAGIAGSASKGVVASAMASADAPVRRAGAAAAGEARLADAETVEALFRLLETDADDLVRSNAAYALGNVARVVAAQVPASRLLKRLALAAEPDNTGNGGMARSTVRVSVMYALCNAALEDGDLAALAKVGLADHDRYVRGLAVALLERHALAGGVPWLGKFVQHLASARYNEPAPAFAP